MVLKEKPEKVKKFGAKSCINLVDKVTSSLHS